MVARISVVLAVLALVMVAGCSSSSGEEDSTEQSREQGTGQSTDQSTEAWAAEVNDICYAFAARVNAPDQSENYIVTSQWARQLAEEGRVAFARIAVVPRPAGKEEEISEMVTLFTNAADKYEVYADALLDKDEARIREVAEEIDEQQTEAQALAADLGVECLAG